MSLLTVVQNAMTLAGLPNPSNVFSSTNDTVQTMVRLVYVEGRDLLKRHDWQQLLTTQTLTCAATNAQTGYPETDFDRMSRGTEMWNTSNDWPIIGPLNSKEWSDLTVRGVTSVPQFWRLIGGVLHVYQPVSGDGIQYEYVSKNWIKQGGTTPAETLMGDNDTFYFPEQVMELGLVWRFKQAKQLDYAEDLRTYQGFLMDAIASDKGGRRVITTSRPVDNRPQRTWPGTVSAV